MKKKPASKSAFFTPRVLITLPFAQSAFFLSLLAFALYPGGNALARQDEPGQPLTLAASAGNPLALSNADLVAEANPDRPDPQVPYVYTEKAPYPMFNLTGRTHGQLQ